jgi:hypothetical protein
MIKKMVRSDDASSGALRWYGRTGGSEESVLHRSEPGTGE